VYEKDTLSGQGAIIEAAAYAGGWSHEDILKNYPGLAADDLLACLSYAGAVLRSERVHPPERVL
jgi:uncharacterized protein (DUF433 family)